MDLKTLFLREKSFEGYDDSSVLECLLSTAGVRTDVPVLVQNMFGMFGTLKGILEARPAQLLTVPGMTEKSAALISMVAPLARVWERCNMQKPNQITNRHEAEAYCKSLLMGERTEKFYVISVNAQCKVIGVTKVSEGSVNQVSAYPRLVAEAALSCNAYTQEAVAALYDRNYRIANSGKLETDAKYHYIVPDPFALFEALLLGQKPAGSLRAGEVYVKGIEPGKKVDVLRSPHMHTSEHAIETVAPYRAAFAFMDTKALYVNVHDLLFRRLQADYDGDIALVDDNPTLVSTAERCNEGLVPLYYDAQKAGKKPLTTDAIVEAIFNAADFNVIGVYSIHAVKLLASEKPDNVL